jgi:hypothetical protein
MHQDDVEQLSQHDLGALNFHCIEADPTTDFTRTLDESWFIEALKSINTHFDGEKGPQSSQAKMFYDSLIRNAENRKMIGPYPDSSQDAQLFGALHTNQMNIPEYTRRLVVKHDSDWHSTRDDPRWASIFQNREECHIVQRTNGAFLDATRWMDKVPPFASQRSVWHFHPLEFLYMMSGDDDMDIKWLTVPNLLLNGVYLWTETKGAGHAFVSVHENNNVYLYTYGRYGRTGPGGTTGDGILNFLIGEDARKYYSTELYRMGARAFRIDDADPELTRKFFEDLWNSSPSAIPTADMPDATRRRGHTIDEYDVTGSNCTTHSVAGIKYSGSKIFENGYTSMTTQLPIEAEEDFTIPVSLQRYLVTKGSELSSMLVVEMTNTFKEQYPNRDNLQQFHESPGGKIQKIAAESAATGDSLSPYSGGTIGGVLGGLYDVNE